MGDQVLIIEDDPVVRADAAALLEDAGLEVVEMDNADDALTYAIEQAADLAAVFTDINLPGDTTGVELADIISRKWPKVVVLVTSGQSQPESQIPQNVRFLPKPWKPADVVTAMRNAVG